MSDKSRLPIVMIGGGGHASVLADILISQGRNILAVISPEDIFRRSVFKGLTHLKKDEDVLAFRQDQVLLVNGIGMMPKSGLKRKVNEYFLSLGYQFETVIADSAYISPFSKIAAGAQVLPFAMVQTGAVVGCHTIINSGALVEHDCDIGEYNHIAPRAVMCGHVKTGSNVFIGANATLIQNIEIEQNAIIGAGVTLTKSVSQNGFLS